MKLSELKHYLKELNSIRFKLPNGEFVPEHFHVTEIGLITRTYIDCGGKLREDKKVNIQLWYSHDLDHRLKPNKLIRIIEQSERLIDLEEYAIEVEYQQETIAKFGLSFKENDFILTPLHTACLAEDQCGIPETPKKIALAELTQEKSKCSPGSKCC